MGEEHRINAIKGVIISRALLKDYGYDGDMPTDAPGPRATVEAMKDVMRFWLDMGCDGFRVDMASSLVKNDTRCV